MFDYAAAYSELHKNEKYFANRGVYADQIAELVKRHEPKSMLDYGSGKGYQYLASRIHEKWGGLLPVCYDVGVRQLAKKPEGKFDAVICTDMLEHIEEADLPEILADIFGYASTFVFLAISTVPARKKVLPDGRNVHLTVKPEAWWLELIKPYERDLTVKVVFDERG